MENSLEIVVGTSNLHKIFEMNEIAKTYNVKFKMPETPTFNPIENGKTFEENAKIKAVEISKISAGSLFIADDSGLCVDFLNGAPGIHSARYEKTPKKRIEKLLAALKNDNKRTARFVCALCLVNKKGEIIHTEKGIVEGKIAYDKKGEGGFGYDPIFVVEGRNKTMAELLPDEKNNLSHRGQALNNMLQWLKMNYKQKES